MVENSQFKTQGYKYIKDVDGNKRIQLNKESLTKALGALQKALEWKRKLVASKGMRPVALYDLYVKWCKAFRLDPENRFVFGKLLAQRDFVKTRSNGKDYWCVKMTESGKEIMAKAFARVDEIVPDKPETEAAPVAAAVNNVVPLPERAVQTEEAIAA